MTLGKTPFRRTHVTDDELRDLGFLHTVEQWSGRGGSGS